MYRLNTILVQLYNAAASPASHLRSAGLLAIPVKEKGRFYCQLEAIEERHENSVRFGRVNVFLACGFLMVFEIDWSLKA